MAACCAGVGALPACGWAAEAANAPLVTAAEAARFLEQSSFGPTPASIALVQQLGFTGFLARQFAVPATGYHGYAYRSPSQSIGCPAGSAATCARDNYSLFPIQMQFFRNALNGPDQLRQRVAFALSQIFVVSGLVINQPYAMAAYQNLLLDDAFENFSKLLTDVTLSPAMGNYLNMVNNNWNPKSNENDPNENYAREVLQLFTIGLVELNGDGSVKLAGGVPISTYGQEQIDSFSDVFTGWTYAPLAPAAAKWTDPVNYGGVMTGFAAHHDNDGGEVLLNGVMLKANGNQSLDLDQALANIFDHPNVGPFIGRQLIQQLVTSNPSPAYVEAVAAAFDDNGKGVRGDMQAVITAILMHPEARSASSAAAPAFGKLREPALMIAGFLRGVGGATQSDGEYLRSQSGAMSEPVFDSPTVFNYYQPSYPLSGSGLVGPPFGIFDGTTSFARYDFVNRLIYGPVAADATVTFIKPTGTSLDLTAWIAAAVTTDSLMFKINMQFFHGAMSTHLTAALTALLDQIPAADPAARAKAALYVALTAPEYQVEQ
jgi:hypothetical protein